MIGFNRYGKAAVRLVRVNRREPHTISDVTVAVRFTGDFEVVHTEGDNRRVLPTDTMKNTIYVLAKDWEGGEIEQLGLSLTERFLGRNPQVESVEVELEERPWERIGDAPHAFRNQGTERRLARVRADRTGTVVEAGVRALEIIKTTDAGFSDFLVDDLTTLAPTDDRILASSLTGWWRYSQTGIDYREVWRGVIATLLDRFADHYSKSIQHSIFELGNHVLERFPEISEVRLRMPNRHHLPVELGSLGRIGPGLLFLPVEEPFGDIEATVLR